MRPNDDARWRKPVGSPLIGEEEGLSLVDFVETAAAFRVDPYGENPYVMRLQEDFGYELRKRIAPDAVLMHSLQLRAGEYMCFLLAREGRYVAIDIVTDATPHLLERERLADLVRRHPLDAVLVFRGKDVFYAMPDCVCMVARQEPLFFDSDGFENAMDAASPSARWSKILPYGGHARWLTDWVDDDGEVRFRYAEAVCFERRAVSRRRRRARGAASFASAPTARVTLSDVADVLARLETV
jgi:hypothetical protein